MSEALAPDVAALRVSEISARADNLPKPQDIKSRAQLLSAYGRARSGLKTISSISDEQKLAMREGARRTSVALGGIAGGLAHGGIEVLLERAEIDITIGDTPVTWMGAGGVALAVAAAIGGKDMWTEAGADAMSYVGVGMLAPDAADFGRIGMRKLLEPRAAAAA